MTHKRVLRGFAKSLFQGHFLINDLIKTLFFRDFPTAFGMVIKKLEKFKSNGTSLEDAKEYANDFGAANDALAVFRNGWVYSCFLNF